MDRVNFKGDFDRRENGPLGSVCLCVGGVGGICLTAFPIINSNPTHPGCLHTKN